MKSKARKITTLILSALLLISMSVALVFMSAPKKSFGIDNGGYVYLSDLYPSEKSVVFYDNMAVNMGYPNGNPSSWNQSSISLLVNGSRTNFSKGIVLQAIGSATYNIANMGITKFTAKVGVNSNGGTCVFVVKVDGVAQFTSSVLNYNSNAVDVNVTIPSTAQTLTIEVQDGGDNANNDHGAFADPKLYCKFADLSDVTPSNIIQGYSPVMFNEGITLPHLIGQGGDGTYVTKPLFEKTINAHANSTVEYNIEGTNAKKFTTLFGINGQTTSGNGVVFSVLIDGVSKATQTVLPQEQFGYFNIDIPTGAKKITLKATDNGNLDYDHARWVNARIYNYNSDVVNKLEVDLEEKVVKPNDTFNTPIKFLDVFGVELDASSYEYTLESSDSEIVKINDNGTATALKGGTVNLTVKATVSGQQMTGVAEVIVADQDNAIVIKSPNGKSELQIVHSTVSGKLYYQLYQNGDRVVNLSNIGQSTSIGDLSQGLEFVSVSEVKEINDTYQTFGGKKDYHTDHCFTKSMTLSKDGVMFTVEARVYDDGGAFRFKVTPTNNDQYTLFKVGTNYGEKTTMSVPKDSLTWSTIMPDTTGKCSPHEQFGNEIKMGYFDTMRVVPFMYKTPAGTYVYVTEAGMNGQYAGVILRSIDSLNMRFSVSNQQQDDIVVSGEYVSSWRTFATGTLEMVYATEIIENVSDPCKIEDTSWIKPGVSSWSWMEGVNNFWGVGGTTNSTVSKKFVCPYCLDTFTSSSASATEQKCSTCSTKCYFCNHTYTTDQTYCPNCHTQRYISYINEWAFDTQQGLQADPEVIKKYIDLSASMGWEYFCMDDGWQPYIYLKDAKAKGYSVKLNEWANFPYYYDGFYDWTQEVCDYAESKGVGLIAWIHTGIMDTEEKMDVLFAQLQAFGIKGIKVDFFDSEEQWIIDLWQLIYKKSAEYKLLVNVHGANKPTGERRTWPNVINREAIYGEEMNNTQSSNMVIQAVLRSICGPSDFTPYFKPVSSSNIWMSGQIALPIIYESGIQCFASKAADYNSLTTEMKFYYTDFPEAWDESIFLSGEVGRNVSIARKGRDVERWYVGGLTVSARTDYIDCSFLDSGRSYTAYIYYGGDQLNNLEYRKETVTSADTISVQAIANGGYAVLFAPAGYATDYSINAPYALTEAKYKLNKYIGVAEGLNQSVFALTSYASFATKLNDAKTLANSGSATEVQLDAMSLTLKQAIDKIEKNADSSSLKTALANAKALSSLNYTSVSFGALQTVISEIEDLNLDRLTALEVSENEIKLNGALNDLEPLIQITVQNGAEGQIGGISNGEYEVDQVLPITITANEHYHIKSVTFNGQTVAFGSNNKVATFNYTVSESGTFKVEYEIDKVTLNVTNSSGKITVTGIENGQVDYGTNLTIVITAKQGAKITSITYNGASVTIINENTMTLNKTATENITLVVNGESKKFTVSVNNDDIKGTVTGVPSEEIEYDKYVNVTVTAKTGYKIISVSYNEEEITVGNEISFTFGKQVKEDALITVTYAQIEDEENDNPPVNPPIDPSEDPELPETPTNKDGGCGSSIAGVSVIGLIAMAISLVVIFIKRKQNAK